MERWEEGTGDGGRARSRHLERKERGAEMERIKPKADAKDGGRRVKKEEERVGRLRRGGKGWGGLVVREGEQGRESTVQSLLSKCARAGVELGESREKRRQETRPLRCR